MGKSRIRKFGGIPAHADHHVVIGVPAGRDCLVGKIGQQHQQLVLPVLALLHLRLQFFGLLLHGGHFLLGSLGLILESLLHEPAYLLGLGLLRREGRVEFCLAGTAAAVLLQYLFYDFRSVKILDCQPFHYEFGLFPQKFKSQHLSTILKRTQI